jgi:hypothetical protein
MSFMPIAKLFMVKTQAKALYFEVRDKDDRVGALLIELLV